MGGIGCLFVQVLCRIRVAHKPLNRCYVMDHRIYTIFEGTSEIQRLIIARAISGVHIQ